VFSERIQDPLYLQKNPIYPQKSPVYQQKSPISFADTRALLWMRRDLCRDMQGSFSHMKALLWIRRALFLILRLFCGYAGLFFEYEGSFADTQGPFFEYEGSFADA